MTAELTAQGQAIVTVICLLILWYAIYHWRNRKKKKKRKRKKKKETFKSKNGYTYYRIKKKDMPKWVEKKFWETFRDLSSIEMENKNYYYKGKKNRYLIRTGTAMGVGGTTSAFHFERKFYKRKRG